MIQIDGQVEFLAPVEMAKASIQDPDFLTMFLPFGSQIVKTGDGLFEFVAERNLGPIAVNLRGRMTLTPQQAGRAIRMLAEGRHLVGGSFTVDLMIAFEGDERAGKMSLSGTMEGSGMIGLYLQSHRDKVNPRIADNFKDIARRLEARKRLADAEIRKARAAERLGSGPAAGPG